MKTKTSLAKTIKDLEFDWVDSDIEKNFTAEDIRGEIKVYHFDRTVTSEDVVKEMAKDGYLPANLSELLAYAKDDWNGKDWIVSLGSEALVRGYRRVPCLDRGGAGRDLDLSWWDDGWHGLSLFLAVRNSDSGTQSSENALGLSTAPNGSNISGGFTPPNTPELKLK
jgi:hypothetical protein